MYTEFFVVAVLERGVNGSDSQLKGGSKYQPVSLANQRAPSLGRPPYDEIRASHQHEPIR